MSAISKNAQLNSLFEGCKKERGFVADGIISEPDFDTCKMKLLFLLKDTNGTRGEQTDLREYVKEYADFKLGLLEKMEGSNAVSKTWSRIGKWAHWLITQSMEFTEYSDPSDKEIGKALLSISAVNIKKEPGKRNANQKEIRAWAKEDNTWKKEIKIIAPQLVICCGTFEETLYGLDRMSDYSELKKLKNFHTPIKYENAWLLDFYHPKARGSDEKFYNYFKNYLNEIKEQINFKKKPF
jgi:hypothetical protein